MIKRLYQVLFAIPLFILLFISIAMASLLYLVKSATYYIIFNDPKFDDSEWAKWCNPLVKIFNKLLFIKES